MWWGGGSVSGSVGGGYTVSRSTWGGSGGDSSGVEM